MVISRNSLQAKWLSICDHNKKDLESDQIDTCKLIQMHFKAVVSVLTMITGITIITACVGAFIFALVSALVYMTILTLETSWESMIATQELIPAPVPAGMLILAMILGVIFCKIIHTMWVSWSKFDSPTLIAALYLRFEKKTCMPIKVVD